MADIRIKFQIDKGSATGDMTDFVNSIDRSIQSAATKVTSALDGIEKTMERLHNVGQGAFASMDQSMKAAADQISTLNVVTLTLLSTLHQVTAASGKIGGGGGGGGGGGKALLAQVEAEIKDKMQELNLLSAATTSTRYGKKGILSTSESYKNESGSATVTRNADNEMTGAVIKEKASATVAASQEAKSAILEELVAREKLFRVENTAAIKAHAQMVDMRVRSELSAKEASELESLSSQQEKYNELLHAANFREDFAAGNARAESMAEEARRLAVLSSQQEKYNSLKLQANQATIRETGGIFSDRYRKTSSSYGANGELDSTSFSRAAGLFRNAETISLNAKTGEMTRQVKEMSSQAAKFWKNLAGEGPIGIQLARASINSLRGVLNGALAPVRMMSSIWRSIGNQAIRVSALFYSIERISRGVSRTVVAPFEAVVTQTEKAVKFQESIAGVVGGMGSSKQVDDSLIQLSRSLPTTLEQIRQTASEVSHISALSPQFAISPQSAVGMTSQLTDIVTRLSIANPQSNPEEISRAINNAMIGNLRSLRMIAKIDPNDLVNISGLTQKELQSNQGALLNAIQQLANNRVPDSVLKERTNLPSIQWAKFMDQVDIGLMRIGEESGLMSTIAGKFHDMMEELASYVDSPEFHAAAKAIGDDLSHIFGNIVHAGATFLQGLTGSGTASNGAATATQQIQDFVHTIAGWSDTLPTLSNKVGEFFRGLTGDIEFMLNAIAGDAVSAKDRVARIGQSNAALSYDKGPYATSDQARHTRDMAQFEAISAMLNALYKDPHATSAQYVTSWHGVKDDFHNGQYMSSFQRLSDAYSGMGTKDLPEITGNRNNQKVVDALVAATKDMAVQVDSQGRFTGEFIDTAKAQKLALEAVLQGGDKSILNHATLNERLSAGQQRGVYDPSYISRNFSRPGEAAVLGDSNLDMMAGSRSPKDLFTGLFGAAFQGAGDLDLQLPKTAEKWKETLELTQSYLASVYQNVKLHPGDKGGSVFDLAPQMAAERSAAMMAMAQHADDTVRQDGSHLSTKNLEELITLADKLREAAANLTNGVTPGLKAMLDMVHHGAQNAAIEYVRELKSEGGMVQYLGAQRAIAGQVNSQVTTGAGGYENMDATQQRLLMQSRAPSGVAFAKSDPVLMQMLSGMSDSDLANMNVNDFAAKSGRSVGKAGSFFGGPGTDDTLKAALQAQLAQQQAEMQSAQASYLNATPGKDQTDAATAMDKTALAVEKTATALQRLSVETDRAMSGFIEFGNAAQNSLEQGLGTALGDAIMGSKSLQQVFTNMVHSIVNEWSQMVTHQMFQSLFGNPNGQPGVGNGIGGITGAVAQGIMGLFGGGGDFGGSSSGIASAGGDFAANGAVWPGFTPFAGGGIARHPTLGMVGERADRTPEAIIPMLGRGGTIPLGIGADGSMHAILPGGRRIGASVDGMSRYADGGIMGGAGSAGGAYAMGGGAIAQGQTNVHVYHVGSESQANQHAASVRSKDGRAIIAIAKAEMVRDLRYGGVVSKAAIRGPGH